MTEVILDQMDSWKRIAGDADANGAFTIYNKDLDSKNLLTQLLTVMQGVSSQLGTVTTQLNGIRARLDAGINTKTVTTLATVNV